jgi:hypothetical protein
MDIRAEKVNTADRGSAPPADFHRQEIEKNAGLAVPEQYLIPNQTGIHFIEARTPGR